MRQYLTVVIIFGVLLTFVQGQTRCTGNDDTGDTSPNGGSDGGQTNTYYMICTSRYTFSCCGIINRWEYVAEQANVPVELIVWRPTGVGSNYKIAFKYTHTPANANFQQFPPSGDYVAQQGDCLGWHSSTIEVLGYRTGGGGVTAQYLPASSVNVNGITDWSTAANHGVSNAEWSIYARSNNPTSPTFPAQTTSYSIPESTAVSTSVATVTFSDTDLADTLTLTLTSASPSGYFVLVDNGDGTGTVNTHSTKAVTGIVGQTATLNFRATDLCGLTQTGSFTITIQNDPPVLTNLAVSKDVGEDMLVQTTVTTFTCSDTSGTVSVSSTENPSNAPNAAFFFTKYVSGNEYALMARAQTSAAQGQFDYNTQRYYDITVRCSDSVDTVTGVIRADLVPNSPPVITNLPAGTSVTVSQTAAVGTVAFTVSFTDADGDTVSLAHTSNPASPFEVLDSGKVQVKESIETYTAVGFDLYITPSDSKNAGIQRTLTILITDINSPPKLTNLNSNVVVDENTANPTTIFTVSYTDNDAGNTHTFFMTNPDAGTSYFEISTAGVVSTKAAINYESLAVKIFPFTVVISDGRASASGTLTVTIADVNEALTWNSATYRTDLTEQSAVGTTLANPGFAVTDPDTGDTYTCGMNCGSNDGYFSMSTDCKVKVTSVYSLDSGMSSSVTCSVTAVDKGGHTATTTLLIAILEANNYKPKFTTGTYSFVVTPYAGSGTSIGTTTATDSDAGTFGQFSYSLDQTRLQRNYFKIDSTGLISTQVSMPDVCNCSDVTYAVPVLATDTGGLVGTATVYITVTATTTTTTTTTTDRMLTFFDDTKNIVWFSLLMLVTAVTAVVTVFVCVKYVCTGPSLCRGAMKGIKGRYNYWRPASYNRHELREITRTREPQIVKSRVVVDSVRAPPPPKELQIWRTQQPFS